MKTITLTLVQTQIFWEDKQANLQMLQEKIAAIQEKTEVVVLPEMFSTGFSMNATALAETMDGPTITWMREQAAYKKVVLTGSLIIREGDRYFNRLIWMLPNGTFGFYDKRHMFAYAGEDRYFSAGNKRLIASVNGWKINLQVCYDLRFPVWSRQSSPGLAAAATQEAEYDVLVYVANWPERRQMAWATLLQARAIENQCYVVGVNRVGRDGNDIYYSGNSMVIGPLGEMLYQKQEEEDAFSITLEMEALLEARSRFPFLKDRDGFIITE